MNHEFQQFMSAWERETKGTIALLESLPRDQYDFRPDPLGRSLGELAWHLAEIDSFTTLGIAQRKFEFPVRPANMTRPRAIAELAPGFASVHRDAVERMAAESDMSVEVTYADGTQKTIRELLWQRLLLHQIHHRGQLVLLARLAGGVPPGLYGPTREQMPRKAVAAN
jgi:uncharacterized damage-inducible protein DinB